MVTPFLAAADAALGAGYSALLYGSAARGDYIAGRSDINLLLVLDDPSPGRLRALAPAFATWRKATAEPPLLISRAEWDRASDVFPIEITDMRAGYRVLRGADPLGAARVQRPICARRSSASFAASCSGCARATQSRRETPSFGAARGRSAGTILVLLRALLTLAGRPVPAHPRRWRRRRPPCWTCPPNRSTVPWSGERSADGARRRRFEQYLNAVSHAAEYVDHFQLGDL